MNPEPPPTPAAETEMGRPLQRMVQIGLRRLNWVLGGLVVGTLLATLKIVTTTPAFEASSLVMVLPTNPTVTPYQKAYEENRANLAYYKSQAKLIKSRAVAEAVAEAIKDVQDDLSEFSGLPNPAAAIRGRISVAPVRESFLMRVKFHGRHAKEVQRLTNEVVKAYIRLDEKRRNRMSGAAIRWLTESLPKLRKDLDEAEKQLLGYQEQNGGAALNGQSHYQQQEVSRLRRELSDLRLRRVALEARHQRVRKAGAKAYLHVAELAQDPRVSRLGSQHMELKLEKEEQARKFGPKHHTVQGIEQQIAIVGNELQKQLSMLAMEIADKYRAVQAEDSELKALLDRTLAGVKQHNRHAVGLETRKQDVDRLRQLYEVMLQRLGEVSLVSTMRPMHIYVVDEAKLPTTQIQPAIQRMLGFGVLFGLTIGLCLAFLIEHLDDRILSPEDLAEQSGCGIVGYIPNMAEEQSRGPGGQDVPICLSSPDAPISEPFRALRTSVLLSQNQQDTGERNSTALLVVSAQKGEGKTTVAVNLAIVMAQAGKKVLLMECDLRQPCLHQQLGFNGTQGLGTILAGYKSLDEVTQTTAVEGLDFLGAGPRPPQPSELLGSPSFEALVAEARGKYDWIIMDSPPLLAVTDGMVLTAVVDGVIQVVRARVSRRRLLRRSMGLLDAARSRHLGLVVNDVLQSEQAYYYYYDYDNAQSRG